MMYDHIIIKNPNISINDIDFYMESFSSDEPVQRREFKRTSLMNGTEYITKGKWIGRQFSFKTHITVPIDNPDAYDDILAEFCNGICDVVSLDLGSFKAEVTCSKTHNANNPDMIELSFTVKEIAEKSGIANDEVIVPPTEVVKEVEDKQNTV